MSKHKYLSSRSVWDGKRDEWTIEDQRKRKTLSLLAQTAIETNVYANENKVPVKRTAKVESNEKEAVSKRHTSII